MSTISGVAKLANNDPAVEVIATHIAGRGVYRATPSEDGVYSILGVPSGSFVVTALGPAGYRPQSHEVLVPISPEAASIWPMVLSALDFETTASSTSLLYDKVGSNNFSGTAVSIPGFRPESLGIDQSTLLKCVAPLGISGEAFAVSVWFRWSGSTTASEYIFAVTNGDGAFNERFWASARREVAGNVIGVGVLNQSNNSYVSIPNANPSVLTFPDGEWVHGLFSFSAGQINAWINGVPAGGGSVPVMALTNFNQIVLGHNNANRFSGLDRDDMLFLIGQPTDADAVYLYAAGHGRTWQDVKADGGYG